MKQNYRSESKITRAGSHPVQAERFAVSGMTNVSTIFVKGKDSKTTSLKIA